VAIATDGASVAQALAAGRKRGARTLALTAGQSLAGDVTLACPAGSGAGACVAVIDGLRRVLGGDRK
jgi:hypothetical protein